MEETYRLEPYGLFGREWTWVRVDPSGASSGPQGMYLTRNGAREAAIAAGCTQQVGPYIHRMGGSDVSS